MDYGLYNQLTEFNGRFSWKHQDAVSVQLFDSFQEISELILRRKSADKQQKSFKAERQIRRYVDDVIESNQLLNILSWPHYSLEHGKVFDYTKKQIYQMIRDYAFFKDFFKLNRMDYDLESIYHLCTKLQMEMFPKNHVILKEGTPSNDKMYLIVIGRILVTSRNNQLPVDNYKKPSTERSPQKKHYGRNSPGLQLLDFEGNLLEQLQAKYGGVINELAPGNYFGERALLVAQQKIAVRSASCIAATDVYVLTLNREDFMEVLKQFKKDSQLKREILTACIPKFEQITSSLIIENLMYSFKEIQHNKDDHLTIEGGLAEQFYIILEGEVGIMKNYKGHKLLLCILGVQEIIGEESLFLDQYNYTAVILQQDTRLLKVSAGSLLLRSPKYCINGLRKMMIQKDIMRAKQMTIILKQNEVSNEKTKQEHQEEIQQIMQAQVHQAQEVNALLSLQKCSNKPGQEQIRNTASESFPFPCNISKLQQDLLRNRFTSQQSQMRITNKEFRITSFQSFDGLRKQIDKENTIQSLNIIPLPSSTTITSLRSLKRTPITRSHYIDGLKQKVLNQKRKFQLKQVRLWQFSQSECVNNNY